MQVLLAGNHETIVAEVRRVVLREGLECPADHVVPLAGMIHGLNKARPDLLILVLTPDPERALSVLAEARDATRGRVVVVGPSIDPKLVVQALRGGADDYVDEEDIEADLIVALGRMRRELQSFAGEEGRIIAVLAPSGGSGSSTLAANIAASLAREHKSTVLMDLKLESGDISALLDVKPTHTIADLCQNVSRLDRVMFERSLTRHSSGVHLLASPLQFSDVQFVSAEGVRKALGMAKIMFPYVVIDLDHTFHSEQVEALRLAHQILIVLRLDFSSLRNARRTLDYLENLNISRERIQLVVNRYGQPKEVPFGKAEEALGLKIAHYIPDDPRTVNRANNDGVPVVIDSPSSKVSKSLVKVAASVNGKHAKAGEGGRQ
jgi:pilus assembly protein CpaE